MNRNVILFALDSARKDAYDEVAHTKEMADIRYESTYSASCWSVPSHASMFTGLLPSEHGIHTYNRNLDLSGFETICDRWDGHTVGISSNVYASSTYGFDKIFDEFVDAPRYQPFLNGVDATRYFHNSGRRGIDLYLGFLEESLNSPAPVRSLANGLFAQLKTMTPGTKIPDLVDDGAKLSLNWLHKKIEESNDPIFGFANLMETHEPYSFFYGIDKDLVSDPAWCSNGPTRWDLIYAENEYERHTHLVRQYHRATIEYVTRLITAFAEEHPETTIIVTSDHGENLGYATDNGLWRHTSSLSDGLCHVPLDVINAPGKAEKPDGIISHLDLMDLINEFGCGQVPNITRTIAPAETMGIAAGPEPPQEVSKWDRTRRACWKVDKKAEWDNIDSDAPNWAKSMFSNSIRIADGEAKQQSASHMVDDAAQARLKDLGYI